MVGLNLKLRPMAQAFVASAAALTYPAMAAALALETRHPEPPPAWLAVSVSLAAFLLLIWALSKLVHSDRDIERALREESKDKSVTPVPDDDYFHPHIFH